MGKDNMDSQLQQLQDKVDSLTQEFTALKLAYGVHAHTSIDGTQEIATDLVKVQNYSAAAGGTVTINLANGRTNHIQMPAGNITIALLNATVAKYFIIRIKQDSVGSRTVTWFSGISWPGNTVPTLTTTANHWDTFGFEVTGTGTFDGFIVGQNLQ